MNTIQNKLLTIRESIPDHVRLICVSKFHPTEAILEAYNAGEREFGESKVQEMSEKQSSLPLDIKWHFIGHLQRNKVKYIVPYVELIHGVDSEKILTEINIQARKINRKVNCLLQIHIAQEESKFGFDDVEIKSLITKDLNTEFPFINFCGLMGMATFTEDLLQIQAEFRHLKKLFEEINDQNLFYLPDFKILSMGMSDDFKFAIQEGSTMVRIGSKIFGNRNYTNL